MAGVRRGSDERPELSAVLAKGPIAQATARAGPKTLKPASLMTWAISAAAKTLSTTTSRRKR